MSTDVDCGVQWLKRCGDDDKGMETQFRNLFES